MVVNRKSIGRLAGAAVVLSGGTTPALATTYYVSPTGSDANGGTSASSPWQSVTKVDATAFQPGDQVLFQYGGQWAGSLSATSSGTAAAPITYAAYGNAALAKPTFTGSDAVASSAFTPVTGTTFQYTSSSAVNWVYDNHQFTHESQDALTQSGATDTTSVAANLGYVESTPNSFYYNPATSAVYVNLGTSSLAGQALTLGTRQDAVAAVNQSNLVFQNLATTETAADQAGYGFRVQGTSNVTLSGCVASLAGKHNFGAIDSTGFVGQNLVANGSEPDLGYGGASAFVAYSDADPARANNQGNTYAWSNLTYLNANGSYPAFVTHGDAGAIASVSINNLTASGYGVGITAYSTGPAEKITVTGGHLNDGNVDIETDNSTITGLTLTGPDASIQLDGAHDVLQSSLITGGQSNPYVGHDGSVIIGGTDDSVRFNTFSSAFPYGPAVTLLNPTTGAHVYGNLFDVNQPFRLLYDNTTGSFDSDDNLFTAPAGPVSASNTFFVTGDVYDTGYLTLAQWEAAGYDLDSADGPADFVDAADGNYGLAAGSAGLGLISSLAAGYSTPGVDLNGNPFGAVGPYNVGAVAAVPEPSTLGLAAAAALLAARRRRR